jgi:23S rRNA pseudouridine1911/1915/1917 synthase
MSRSRLQQLIDAGHCQRNGLPLRAATKVQPGDHLSVRVPPPQILSLTPWALPLDVLFEDSDILVLNKPAGLVVHPGSGTHAPTLVHALLAHCKDLSGIGGVLRPGIVHRLDAGTTGALVVAKHDTAHAHLAAQFAQRRVSKRYVALVRGHVQAATGTCDSLLGRHSVHRQRFCSHPTQGKRAVTHFRVVGRDYGLTLLEITIETGRTHQIRVHMAEMGHPIFGDPVYGGRVRNALGRGAPAEIVTSGQSLDHQALHAAALEFIHPRFGTEVLARAPIPASWAPIAQLLSRAAP